VKCSVRAVGDCSGGSVITVAIVAVALAAFDVREKETYVQDNEWNMNVAWVGYKIKEYVVSYWSFVEERSKLYHLSSTRTLKFYILFHLKY
jgi:hypothetical protein